MNLAQARVAALVTALVASPGLAEEKETVSAIAASAKLPAATFRDVHEAYFRLVVHEAGLVSSLPDQDGILAALLNSGGGRVPGRSGRGTGYGLVYRRVMSSMLANSPRTFPISSPFLAVLSPKRMARVRSAKDDSNRWASTLRLDCREPEFWRESYGPWTGYRKRCTATAHSTELMLKGKIESHCTGPITAWGSLADRDRRGGPRDEGWNEFTCDRPPVYASDPPADECPRLRELSGVDSDASRRLLNTGNCARNFFFSWRRDDRSYALR